MSKTPGSGPDDGAHHPSSTDSASCEALGPQPAAADRGHGRHRTQRDSPIGGRPAAGGWADIPTQILTQVLRAFPPQATPAAHHRKWEWQDQAQPRPHWQLPTWAPEPMKLPLLPVETAAVPGTQAAHHPRDLSTHQQWGPASHHTRVIPTQRTHRVTIWYLPVFPTDLYPTQHLPLLFPIIHDIKTLAFPPFPWDSGGPKQHPFAFFFSLPYQGLKEGIHPYCSEAPTPSPKSGWEGTSQIFPPPGCFSFPPVYFLFPCSPLPLKPCYELSCASWASSKNKNGKKNWRLNILLNTISNIWEDKPQTGRKCLLKTPLIKNCYP